LCEKLVHDPAVLPVLGDGSQQKPYLHVHELIDAMTYIISADRQAGRRLYNIGPEDEGVRVSELVEAVVTAAGGTARIAYGTGNRGWIGDVPRFRYSTRKLAGLGWRPSLSSREAMLRAVDEITAEWGINCSRS